MSAANLRMNNKRNQYHLICRVISICLCALFCLSFGCTSKKEERLQEIDFTVVDDDEIPHYNLMNYAYIQLWHTLE